MFQSVSPCLLIVLVTSFLLPGLNAQVQTPKDVHYSFRNTEYMIRLMPSGSGLVYEGGSPVASILVDGRLLAIPGHDIAHAQAAYQAWKDGAGVPVNANNSSVDSAASAYTVQMMGANMGQILKDGKVVALISPAPGSQTGETVVSTSGGKLSAELMKFYEAYKRGDGMSGSVAKASKGEDGNTPTVQFTNDPHFGNDLVVWRKGHIEVMRDGDKVADLGYTGGGYHEGAAKRGIKIISNEAIAGLTLGHKADPLSTGWEITTVKGTYNTAVTNGGTRAAAGITQKSPYGLEGEAVTATDIFRQQLDPTFTYPGLDKLRKDAGIPDATASKTP